jgi:hypothetical protein
VDKFPAACPQRIRFAVRLLLTNYLYSTAEYSIETKEGWFTGATGRALSGSYAYEVRVPSSPSDDSSWQISSVSTMPAEQHTELDRYMQGYVCTNCRAPCLLQLPAADGLPCLHRSNVTTEISSCARGTGSRCGGGNSHRGT